jgi:hypothetical protein
LSRLGDIHASVFADGLLLGGGGILGGNTKPFRKKYGRPWDRLKQMLFQSVLIFFEPTPSLLSSISRSYRSGRLFKGLLESDQRQRRAIESMFMRL